MADLRIYDFSFNLLFIESRIVSQSHTIYFNDIGKLEIHLAKDSKVTEMLFNNRYLLIRIGDICGIVTGVQIGKTCVIYAKTPNWILTKKVLLPFERTGNVEEILRRKVSSIFEDVPNFELGDLCGAENEESLINEKCVSLFDFVKDTLEQVGLGHRVDFDARKKKWIFSIVSGKKLPLVVSEGLLNCYDTEYVMDLQDYFTSGFYLPELSDEEKEEGIEPTYTECIKEEKSGIFKWEKPLSAKTREEAKALLLDSKCEEKIETNIKKLERGKDYDLGDNITLKFTMGDLKKTQKVKIIGVNLWEEAGNCGKALHLTQLN